MTVVYESNGDDWKLIVSDNGVGKPDDEVKTTGGGLGTLIVKALVKQLEARMEVLDTPVGLSIVVTRATFTSRLPHAA